MKCENSCVVPWTFVCPGPGLSGPLCLYTVFHVFTTAGIFVGLSVVVCVLCVYSTFLVLFLFHLLSEGNGDMSDDDVVLVVKTGACILL